jgi:RNA polymerase sigma factor (sigma-70 family)
MPDSSSPGVPEPERPGFEKFFKANHKKAVRSVRRRLLHNRHMAEDAVSRAWVALVKPDRRFDFTAPGAAPYFFRMVRNIAVSMLRSQTRERCDSLDALPDELPGPDDPQVDALMAAIRDTVAETVDRMSGQAGPVCNGLYIEHKSVEEVAEDTGLNVWQVRYARRLGDKLLRRRLGIHARRLGVVPARRAKIACHFPGATAT